MVTKPEEKPCPRCNTKPLNYITTRLNDNKLNVDVYECNCGFVSIERPHITPDGGVFFTD